MNNATTIGLALQGVRELRGDVVELLGRDDLHRDTVLEYRRLRARCERAIDGMARRAMRRRSRR